MNESYEDYFINKIITLNISDISIDLLHVSDNDKRWSKAFQTKNYDKLEELRRDEQLKNFGDDKQKIIYAFYEGETLYVSSDDNKLLIISKLNFDNIPSLYFGYVFDEISLRILCSKKYNQIHNLIK